jgi:hypothetical protein
VATFSRMVVVCTFCVLTGSIVLPNHLEMLLLFNTAVHLSAGLGRLDYLTTHTSLSPIRRGFAPDFVNYKKGALDSQPQVIKFTSCLPMVGGSLRVLLPLLSHQYAQHRKIWKPNNLKVFEDKIPELCIPEIYISN